MNTAVSFLPFYRYQVFEYYVEEFKALKERGFTSGQKFPELGYNL
jgi:hypothetical protein